MTFVHGKDTYVSVNSNDISTYCTKSTFTRGADTHDTTTFGLGDYRYQSGLKKGDVSLEGIYDNTATTGPRDVLKALIGGAAVTLIRRPDGTGSGKAQDSVSVIMEKYVETSPVADMVTWSADFKMAGAVTTTAQ
jgi:hypothetical protein